MLSTDAVHLYIKVPLTVNLPFLGIYACTQDGISICVLFMTCTI